MSALKLWLSQPVPDHLEYTLHLLGHRLKQVRAIARQWLTRQGKPIMERLIPLLADPRARMREEVVHTLRAIGGSQVRAILIAQLDKDQAQIVRQAILDAVGVPERATQAELTIAAIMSEAEATFQRITPATNKLITLADDHGLRWHDGSPIAPTVINYLIYAQSREISNRLSANDQAVVSHLTSHRTNGQSEDPDNYLLVHDRVQAVISLMAAESRVALAQIIYTTWYTHPRRKQHGWLLPLVAALGDEPFMQRLTGYLRKWAKESTANRNRLANPVVKALAHSHNLAALASVADLAAQGQMYLRKNAHRRLMEAMHRLGLTREELLERLAPRLGFNDQGERSFAYATRQLTVRMGSTGTLVLIDEQGKQHPRPPRSRKQDDAEQIAAARAEWKKLKRDYEVASSKQVHNLEQGLALRRGWTPAQWRTYIMGQPLLRSLASRLVWAWRPSEDTPQQLPTLFRPLRDGSLITDDDQPLALPNDGMIVLMHPAEHPAAGAIWQQHITRYGIVQPFVQVERLVLQVPPERAAQGWWWPQPTPVAVITTLHQIAEQRGWVRSILDRTNGHVTRWKWFRTAGVVAVIETADLPFLPPPARPQVKLVRLGFYATDDVQFADGNGFWKKTHVGYAIQDDVQQKEPPPLLLGSIPAAILSEVLHDFRLFAGGGQGVQQ